MGYMKDLVIKVEEGCWGALTHGERWYLKSTGEPAPGRCSCPGCAGKTEQPSGSCDCRECRAEDERRSVRNRAPDDTVFERNASF